MPNVHPSKPAKINSKYKTVPCKLYATGNCTFGARCTFIHDRTTPLIESWDSTVPKPGEAASGIRPLSHPQKPTDSQSKRDKAFESLSKYLAQTRPQAGAPGTSIGNESDLKRSMRQASPQIDSKENIQYFDTHDTSPGTNGEYSTSKFDDASTSGLYRTKDCKYFLDGACFQGDSCSFKHDNYKVCPGAETKHPYYRTRPCVYYQMGICAKGDLCTYIHCPTALILNSPRVCKFYVGPGTCRYGDRCTWPHVDPRKPARQPSASPCSESTCGTGSDVDQPNPRSTPDERGSSPGEDADAEFHTVPSTPSKNVVLGFPSANETALNDNQKIRLDLQESIHALAIRNKKGQPEQDEDDEVVYTGVSTSPAPTRAANYTYPHSLSLSSRLNSR